MDAAYDHAACALITCTLTGQIVRANDTLLRWTGSREVPASLFDVFTPASLLFFETQLQPRLALGRDVHGAFLTLRAQGQPLPVVLNAARASDSTHVELALLVVREREQYEETLRQSAADAERALAALSESAHAQKMQAVGQMAAGVAHQFSNLLSVIRGNISFAQKIVDERLPDDDNVGEDLYRALGATDKASSIVRELLAFTGRQVVQRRRLDLNDLIRDTAELVVPSLGRDVIWQTRLAEDIWPVFAPADQLQHVITNLVLNARDAVLASGGPGTVRVCTENVPQAANGIDVVQITVEDSGTGMSDDVRARAFDPFFTTKPVGQGMGLGLSMVYGTIEALGGRTWIVSAPGAGTRVIVALPRAKD